MKITDRDLKFTSEYLEEPIPQSSLWMTKYFKSDIRNAFLRYFLCFGTCIRFCEHTGSFCSERYLKRMKSEIMKLKNAHSLAKTNLDFELVANIEMGLFII